MRQFFTMRFWLTVGALVGLLALLWVVLPRSGSPADGDAAADGGDEPSIAERDIDLIEPLFSIAGSPGFAMVDGATDGELQLIIDGTRNVRIARGTPGEITCGDLTQIGGCAVAADLLGEAVLWFSIFPAEARSTINLPAVRGLRDQNEVLLANGWVVPRASVVARTCDEDTTSLGDFVRTFGDDAESVWNVSQQRIVRVICRPGG